jgi:hypothetical protein
MEVVKKVEIFIGMWWPFLVDNGKLQRGYQVYFYNFIQLLCYNLNST